MKEIYQKRERKSLEESLDFIKRMESGEDRDLLMKELEQKHDQLMKEINYLEQQELSEYGGQYDLLKLPEDVLCEDAVVMLIKPRELHKDSFVTVKRQYAYSVRWTHDDEYIAIEWDEHLSDNNLYYSVIDKQSNTYIGYCGVKNLKKKIWEIAIELHQDYCHKGYGYRALKMYLETVAGLLGRNEFSSRVEADNIASQKLMEKLQFKPYGLSEFLLHTEEDKQEVEEEYLDRIDDRYIVLAEKFHTEPRKLLSHVLEYRLCLK